MNWLMRITRLLRVNIRGENHSAEPTLTWPKWLKTSWWLLTGTVFAVMAFVFWQNRETLLNVFRTAHYEYFFWAFVVYTVAVGIVALGWHLIMHDLGGQSKLLLNVKVYVYALAARRLPGTLWYVAGRSVLYQRLGVSGRIAALASGVEVVLSIVSGIMVGALAMFTLAGTSSVSVLLLGLVELVGLTLLHPKILCRLLACLGHQISPGKLTITQVLSWLGAYIIMWIGGGLVAYLITLALYPIEGDQIPLVTSSWSLAGVIAFTTFLLPSSLGASELAFSFMLSYIVPFPIAVAASILIRILTTIFDIILSSLYLLETNFAIST